MSKHIEWSDLYPNTIVYTKQANEFLKEMLSDVREVIQQQYGNNPPEERKKLEIHIEDGDIIFKPNKI